MSPQVFTVFTALAEVAGSRTQCPTSRGRPSSSRLLPSRRWTCDGVAEYAGWGIRPSQPCHHGGFGGLVAQALAAAAIDPSLASPYMKCARASPSKSVRAVAQHSQSSKPRPAGGSAPAPRPLPPSQAIGRLHLTATAAAAMPKAVPPSVSAGFQVHGPAPALPHTAPELGSMPVGPGRGRGSRRFAGGRLSAAAGSSVCRLDWRCLGRPSSAVCSPNSAGWLRVGGRL